MSCPEGSQHNNRPWHVRTEPLMIIEAARNAHPLSIVAPGASCLHATAMPPSQAELAQRVKTTHSLKPHNREGRRIAVTERTKERPQ